MRVRDARVAVTGGAGFIGSHLVDLLLELGNEVIVIDDMSTGSLNNLAHHQHNPILHVERADILDKDAVMGLMKHVDFVFHLAARNVRLSLRQPTAVHEVNATGTLNVLKASASAGVKRFLYCSSSEVNGTGDGLPMKEDYPFRPETIYGASKLAGEYYTLVFHRSGWLETTVARPHNNYGTREHYDGIKGEVIPRFILSGLSGLPMTIYGDGSQTRDFTYVTETADFFIQLMGEDKAVGKVFNICRGEEVSVNVLASLIGELTGSTVPAVFLPGRPSDVLSLHGDPGRLKRLLGSAPQVSIREGLRRTVEWYRRHVPITDEIRAGLSRANWRGVAPEPWLDSDAVARDSERPWAR